MKLKKRGNDYSKAEEQARKDFQTAADIAAEMLEEFDTMGLAQGPAIGGALTQLITQLIIVSPDTPSAIGLLSSCMTNAAAHAEESLIGYFDTGDPVH
jgi:hypothetical protein|tara:strand:- start:1792 stop:2085 length:294 start_codon:yes stop_codon:yes gene_type:complete